MTSQDHESPASDSKTSSDERLGLSELAAAAGVSARTVRYYIAEGLLSPPVAAGAKSCYSRAHLDRLRLIAHFKASYLPLKEIRRRLATLDDAGVRAQLGEPQVRLRPSAAEELDSAASYVDRLLRPSARSPAASPPMAARSFLPPTPVPADSYHASLSPLEATEAGLHEAVVPHAAMVQAPAAPIIDDQGAWRRVALGDDAELLIREEAYQRKRDRVEWLVIWARKVFG